GASGGAARRRRGAGAPGWIARLRHVLSRAGGEQRHRDRVPGAPPPVRPRFGGGRGSCRPAHAGRRFSVAAAAPRDRRRVCGATRPSAVMRLRRHIPQVREWNLPTLDRLGARRWGLALLGALLGGYLTAYLVLFPAPLLHGHGVVPRVLGLSLQEASDQLKKAGLQVQDGGTEAHPTAPQGTIVWQDPPPGVSAPAGLRVTLVSSEGPPKIPVPDVAGLDSGLARRVIAGGGHAGLTRHGGGHRRGPEPLMPDGGGGGGGVRIAPSVLSADLSRLAEQVEQVLAGGADWVHVDVMDGRFVPNLTFGANMIATLRGLTDKPIDVHLMVVEPERYLESFAAAGASVFTFHPEATVHVQRLLAAARSQGMLAGLALNPGSPLQLAEEVVADLDLLLIMTVNPGFGGQTYLPASNDKIRRARDLLTAHGSRAFLAVDGG